MTSRLRRGKALVVALCALLMPLSLGAATPTGVRPALCIPLIWCPQPTVTPTPSPDPTPTATVPGVLPSLPPLPSDGVPDVPGDGGTPDGASGEPSAGDVQQGEPAPTPAPAVPDEGAPIFTGTPAQMSSKGLSFTGLKGISLVTVPTADGGSIRALRISADTITITGFALSVRPAGGPGLVTDADTMTLRGHVSVYLGSMTATTQDGSSLTLGADTPPSLDDVEPGLLHVDMGLIGTIADSIAYTNTDQRIVAAR